MRHVVVVSDLHLCELEPGSGLWMRYRQAAASPDGELVAMIDRLRAEVRGDALELVLNGDVFDFDAPRVLGGRSVFHDQPRDAAHSAPMLAAILHDHAPFVDAIGRVVADGHTVVFIAGNHDLAIGLPEVRAVLTDRVVRAAARAGATASDEALAARVLHRAWFHRTPDGVVVEHGNQYDAYCSVRHPMAPFRGDRPELQPTLGSLAARHLVGRMGFFNPNVETSYMLSGLGYVAHWARHYLISRHSIAVPWLVGALKSFAILCLAREPASRARREADLAAAARETGATPREVARHARLFAPPAGAVLARVARELWLDRLAVVAFAGATGVAIAAVAGLPALVGAALAPAALIAYQLAIPKAPLETNWRRVRRAARSVAKVHRARAVVFGHTHTAEGAWDGGVFFGNTGSWSAAYADLECTKPLEDQRPVVWLSSGADGSISGGLVAFRRGQFGPFHRAPAAAPSSGVGWLPAPVGSRAALADLDFGA